PANCKEALGGEDNYLALLDRLVSEGNYNITEYTDPKAPINEKGYNIGQTTPGSKKITTVLGKDYFEPSDSEKDQYRRASVYNEFDMNGYQDHVLVHEFIHVIYRVNFPYNAHFLSCYWSYFEPRGACCY